MDFISWFGALLATLTVVYVFWQGYRAIRGAHEPRDALWFVGRWFAPPADDPPRARPNREERRRKG